MALGIRASTFRPHRWLRNPLAQMAAGAWLRSRVVVALRVERLETPDGDFVDLGWFNETARGPIAVLVHGIGGGLGSSYVQAMATVLARWGWTSAVLQLRGAGPEPNRTPRIYHHADTTDFVWVCQRIRREHPRRALAAVGWSLGGSIVLNALGEGRGGAPVHAAAVVSAPLRLRQCAEYLRRGSARLYQNLMLRDVKALIERKHRQRHWPDEFDREAVLRARDFMELGDVFTAPMCGYRDAREYCDRADPGRRLRRIRRPTLIVQARDDPFLGPAVLPPRGASPQVRVEIAEHGGHVGFVGPGRWGAPESWLEPRLMRFLEAATGNRLSNRTRNRRIS